MHVLLGKECWHCIVEGTLGDREFCGSGGGNETDLGCSITTHRLPTPIRVSYEWTIPAIPFQRGVCNSCITLVEQFVADGGMSLE